MSNVHVRVALLGWLIAVLFSSPAVAQEASGKSAPQAPGGAAAAGTKQDGATLPGWLVGKWVFDEEFTTKKYGERKKPEDLSGLGEALVVPQLLEKLKGSHLDFSDKELVMTLANGNGKAMPFVIQEVPDENTITLKQTDGEITSYHREGERFWLTSTGNVNAPFYFKRAER